MNATALRIMDTDLFRSVDNDQKQERLERVCMKRIGSAEDVAKAALYLASGFSEYVTGQVLGVDGGALI